MRVQTPAASLHSSLITPPNPRQVSLFSESTLCAGPCPGPEGPPDRPHHLRPHRGQNCRREQRRLGARCTAAVRRQAPRRHCENEAADGDGVPAYGLRGAARCDVVFLLSAATQARLTQRATRVRYLTTGGTCPLFVQLQLCPNGSGHVSAQECVG